MNNNASGSNPQWPGGEDNRGSWYGSGGDGYDNQGTPPYPTHDPRDPRDPYGYSSGGPYGYGEEWEDPRDSLGQWVVSLIITLIPFVGIAYLIFVAISSKSSPAKQNWARAMLIVAAFITAFIIIFGDPTGMVSIE